MHSHWVAGIDDGARTHEDGHELLVALHRAGFDRVVATPHMRPGMFENTATALRRAYDATVEAVGASESVAQRGLPAVALSSEHWFDDVVFARLLEGEALPYPGGHAVLVEFPVRAFPLRAQHRFHDLMRRNLCPVLAHPERYDAVADDITVLDPLLDVGAVLLLDVAALAGKYGRGPRKAAEKLLDDGYYFAACSDAHRAPDVRAVEEGIEELFERVGDEEARFLLVEGPTRILDGRIKG